MESKYKYSLFNNIQKIVLLIIGLILIYHIPFVYVNFEGDPYPNSIEDTKIEMEYNIFGIVLNKDLNNSINQVPYFPESYPNYLSVGGIFFTGSLILLFFSENLYRIKISESKLPNILIILGISIFLLFSLYLINARILELKDYAEEQDELQNDILKSNLDRTYTVGLSNLWYLVPIIAITFLIVSLFISIVIEEKKKGLIDDFWIAMRNKTLEVLNYEDLEYLINEKIKENDLIEYKREYTKPQEITKEVCAFANSKGGYLILGIEETEDILLPKKPSGKYNTGVPKEIIGIDKGAYTETITQLVYKNTDPNLKPQIKSIPHKYNNEKEIIIIKIKPSKEPVMQHIIINTI